MSPQARKFAGILDALVEGWLPSRMRFMFIGLDVMSPGRFIMSVGCMRDDTSEQWILTPSFEGAEIEPLQAIRGLHELARSLDIPCDIDMDEVWRYLPRELTREMFFAATS